MRRRNRAGSLLLATAVCLGGTLTSIDVWATDFSQDTYTAPPAPADLLWVERAAPVSQSAADLVPVARVTLGYVDDPLVVSNPNTGQQRAVIDSEVASYVSLGIVLQRRLFAALLLPTYLRPSGDGLGELHVEGFALGDPGVDLRLSLLTRENPIELALATTVRLPLGSSGAFASDGTVSAWPRAIASTELGEHLLFAVSSGPLLRSRSSESGLRIGNALRTVAGLHWRFDENWGVTAEAAGSTLLAQPFRTGASPLELMGGVRFQRGAWVAQAGAGPGLSSAVGTPDLRALASLAVSLGDATLPRTHDRDGDGLEDERDSCPHQAEDRDGFRDDDGCPDTDNDGDGIADSFDSCPNQAEDRDAFRDDDGCPELDNDLDTIPDTSDRCPLDAEDADGFADEDGCPDKDNDGDGVLDQVDRCPLEAEDPDHWQDDDGCPEPDNDNDKILDSEDHCPNEAETMNGVDDADGCPDFVRVESGQIRTLEPIYFEYRSAKIQRRSEPLLAELSNLIKSRPDLGHISIEGHTDSQGADDYNLKLSDDRAKAVMKFLVEAGVESARLAARGFGETKPIDDNRKQSGRARNRRVEFKLVDMELPAAAPASPAVQ